MNELNIQECIWLISNISHSIGLVKIVAYTVLKLPALAYIINKLGTLFITIYILMLEKNKDEDLNADNKNISGKCPICGHNHLWYKCPLLHLLGAVCVLYVIVYLNVSGTTPAPLPETPALLPETPAVPLPEVFNKVYLDSLPEVYKIKQYSYLLSLLKSNLTQAESDQQFLADILQALRKGVLDEPIVDGVWLDFIYGNNKHDINTFINFCNNSVLSRAMAR